MSALVYILLRCHYPLLPPLTPPHTSTLHTHFDRADRNNSTWCFGIPARLPWYGPSYVAWSLLSQHKGSKLVTGCYHTSLASARSWRCSSPAGQCPTCHKWWLGSTWPPKATWHTKPIQSCFYMGPLSVQQTRERTYRESWGVAGALQGLEFSRVKSAGECHCLCPPPPPQGGWGFYPCALAHLQGRCSILLDMLPEPILAPKGASRINRALLYTPGLPAWSCSSLVDQCAGHLRHPLNYYCYWTQGVHFLGYSI